MEYKVIEIVDQYTIAINYGKNDGAKLEQKIVVYEKGKEIHDHNTFVGYIEIYKEVLEIIRVSDGYSLCQKLHNPFQSPFANLDIKKKRKIEADFMNECPTDVELYSNKPIMIDDLVKVL